MTPDEANVKLAVPLMTSHRRVLAHRRQQKCRRSRLTSRLAGLRKHWQSFFHHKGQLKAIGMRLFQVHLRDSLTLKMKASPGCAYLILPEEQFTFCELICPLHEPLSSCLCFLFLWVTKTIRLNHLFHVTSRTHTEAFCKCGSDCVFPSAWPC